MAEVPEISIEAVFCTLIWPPLQSGQGRIRPAARVKRSGDGRTLTEDQESAIQQIICDKRPEQLKMEFALWSRAAVMQLIHGFFPISVD
jgi:hypothetical protein